MRCIKLEGLAPGYGQTLLRTLGIPMGYGVNYLQADEIPLDIKSARQIRYVRLWIT